jgi:hypothetical protein
MPELPPTRENAERLMRRLLRDNDLPQPDEILPHEDGILCLWHEPKVAVVIDLEEGRSDEREPAGCPRPTPRP